MSLYCSVYARFGAVTVSGLSRNDESVMPSAFGSAAALFPIDVMPCTVGQPSFPVQHNNQTRTAPFGSEFFASKWLTSIPRQERDCLTARCRCFEDTGIRRLTHVHQVLFYKL